MTIKEETLHSNIETVNSKQLAVLKKHFPQCFDKSGNFIQEKMLEVVNANEVELSKESYTLNWLGKSYARLLTNLPPKTLINEDIAHNQLEQNKNSKNLLIKGDNLEVLKHMVNAYSDKVKMIYIDPPYNTGSGDFVYNDDRKFTKEQLAELAAVDLEEAERILEFTDKGSSSHSAWLTFMYPRLYVARELLHQEGAILISIDDNQYAQLKVICDEIFGQANFMGTFVWEGGRKNDAKRLSVVHDYILVYVKSDDLLKSKGIKWKERKNGLDVIYKKSEELLNLYHDDFDKASQELGKWFKSLSNDVPAKEHSHYKKLDRGGPYYGDNISSPNYRENLIFEWKGHQSPKNGWRYNKEAMEKLDAKGLLIYPESNEKRIQYKRYLRNTETWTPSTHIYKDRRAASKSLEALMGHNIFDFPKDVGVLSKLVNIFTNENDRILDFFSGSGSTAHAILNINAKEELNRRFISIQLPEPTSNKSKAFEVGYNTIFDITKARITKAAEKISEEHPDFQGDLGFKIFETVEDFRVEDDDKEMSLMTMTMFDDVMLTDEQYHTLLTTWRLYDGSELTTPVQDIDLENYTAHLCDNRLYMIASDFSSDALKALLSRLDTDKEFSPNKVVFFGKNFDSVKQMELNEALKSYANKKSLEIDLVGRN